MSCKSVRKEEESHMTVLCERPKTEERALDESPFASVKENDLTEAVSVEQADEKAIEISKFLESTIMEHKEILQTEDISSLNTEENLGIVLPNKPDAPINKSKEKAELIQEMGKDDQDCSVQKVDSSQETLKATFVTPVDQCSGSKTYFKTTSQSQEEELTQSYYELSLKAETKSSGEHEYAVEKLEQEGGKVGINLCQMSLEQNLSLNITGGSSAVHTIKADKSSPLSESLYTIGGCVDKSEVSPSTLIVESCTPKFPPKVSITPTSATSNEDIPTKPKSTSDEHRSSFEQSESLSEMLDLAGVLPCPSLVRREIDYTRRKSVPANVSALVGSSLDKFAMADQISKEVAGERQLEELGYCVFSECSAPMPSPADLPSPGYTLQHCFPSMDSEIKGELGVMDVKEIQKQTQISNKQETATKISQKPDSPVKTSLILEKAVTSGIKPDRLRIPMTTSKDRLTELRLETGLPGDIKIQAIPEVDVEKDPSREASPIPPDTSFTFTPTEIGSKVPLTPITPKSPAEASPAEFHPETQISEGRKVKEDVTDTTSFSEGVDEKPDLHKEKNKPDHEVLEETDHQKDVNNIGEAATSSQVLHCSMEKTKDSKIQSEHSKPARSEGLETQETSDTDQALGIDKNFKPQELTLTEDFPRPHLCSPIIIIPQTQIDEEVEEEDDIEIAEEPQEIMEELIEPQHHQLDKSKERSNKELGFEDPKTDQVRLMVGDQLLEDDPVSGAEEWSHSALNSDEGEPITDSSHLSPCSDPDLPPQSEDGGEAAQMKVDKKEAGIKIDELKDEDIKKNQSKGKKAEADSGEVEEGKEKKTLGEGDSTKEEETEIGVEATSQAGNDETTMDVSILETDSGWMDSQGT